MEGIVAKPKLSPYRETSRPLWIKIKNREYSQAIGRREFFERVHATIHRSRAVSTPALRLGK
jgi:ATP-dependent DNA ligase